MNTHASNPFTGLKGALAGLMSGGLLGLLLTLLFRRRIAPLLAALENLFAQWQAGTLKLPAIPVAARAPAAAPRARRLRRPSGRRVRVSRCQSVLRVAAPRIGAAAPHGADAPIPLPPSLRVLRPPRRRARCTENPGSKPRLRTP